MGVFKDMLIESLERVSKTDFAEEVTAKILEKQQSRLTALIGEPIIWKSKSNSTKVPQLVVVEEVYDRYAVVYKTTYSAEGVHYVVRYTILLVSLICKDDEIETLEWV